MSCPVEQPLRCDLLKLNLSIRGICPHRRRASLSLENPGQPDRLFTDDHLHEFLLTPHPQLHTFLLTVLTPNPNFFLGGPHVNGPDGRSPEDRPVCRR